MCTRRPVSEPIQIQSNVVVRNDLEHRLKQAAQVAKETLSCSEPLSPIILSNHSECAIIVRESVEEEGVFIIVQKGDGTPLLNMPKLRYRYLYLSSLVNCRVFIRCKLLRLMFDRCTGIQVSLRAPLIGPIEFFRCVDSNLSVSFPTIDEQTIPLISIEECSNFNIYQSNPSLVYLIKLCSNICGTIIDEISRKRISNHSLGKLIWDSQERSLVCLSRTDGFIFVPFQYALNDIEHHLFSLPPDGEVEIDENLFGTTPPTRVDLI